MGSVINKERSGSYQIQSDEVFKHTELGQIPNVLFSWLSESDIPYTIDEGELEHVRDVDIVKLTPKAGHGHKRVCFDVSSALKLDASKSSIRTILELDNLMAGKTHATGSNNRIAKRGIDLMQEHFSVQWAFSWLHHQVVLNKDSETILAAARDFISKSKHQDIFFIAYHPDVAYVLSHHKYALMKESGKRLRVIPIITDDLQWRGQFVWYPIDADLILAPSEGSKRIAEGQLKFWERIMRSRRNPQGQSLPTVEAVSYPVNPFLIQNLTDAEIADRLLQLTEGSGVRTQILVPQGGAVPNPKFQLDFVGSLPASFQPHVIIKSSSTTHQYERDMTRLGANVIAEPTSVGALSAYLKAHATLNPSAFESKPSELFAHTLIPVDRRGGEIMLVAPPVGDQEKQNYASMVLRGVAVPLEEARRMHKESVEQLAARKTQAQSLRAVPLPENGVLAAQFTSRLKQAKFLLNMMNYKDTGAEKHNGAREIWLAMNEFQRSLIKKRGRN